MKTRNIKSPVVVILLLLLITITNSTVFSQSDYVKKYYTSDFSIEYPADTLKAVSMKTGEMTSVASMRDLENINTVGFINDSIIRVSGGDISNVELNINRINSISIESGSYTAIGIGIGTLAGLGVGALIISSTETEDPVGFIVEGTGNTLLGGLSVIAGALIGGIIGGNINTYDKYYMDEFKYNKKKELERILKTNNKLRGVK